MSDRTHTPTNLDRYRWWEFGIPPLVDDPDLPRDMSEQYKEWQRDDFHLHLNGPCGKADCRWDREILRAPATRWRYTALRLYVRLSMGGEWRQDSAAQKVYLSLPPHQQRAMDKLDEPPKNRPSWRTLLATIADDLECFRRIIRGGQSGSLDSAERKIYAAYRSQASRLLGNLTPLDRLAKKGNEFVKKCVAIIERDRRDPLEVRSARRNEAVRRQLETQGDQSRLARWDEMFARRQLQIRDHQSTMAKLRSESRLARRAEPVRICRNMDEVFAWFALALKNLRRYRRRQPPLRWPTPEVERRRGRSDAVTPMGCTDASGTRR